MCGRYRFFAERDIAELNRIIEEVLTRHPGLPAPEDYWREVFPTNRVPVLTAEQGGVAADIFTWGFPGFSGKSVIINARAETAQEKPLFREPVRKTRCVIPTTGFYEWSHTGEKQKYLFTGPSPVLYLAGLYAAEEKPAAAKLGSPAENQFDRRFVILTTPANASMREIHNRMPLILKEEDIEAWIFDDRKAVRFLSAQPPELERECVV